MASAGTLNVRAACPRDKLDQFKFFRSLEYICSAKKYWEIRAVQVAETAGPIVIDTTSSQWLLTVMLKRRPCRLQTADCADRPD